MQRLEDFRAFRHYWSALAWMDRTPPPDEAFMRPAEATSKDTSIVATLASSVSSRSAGQGIQPFASVLQATRQSSQMLMRMMAPPQPGGSESLRANKSRDESSSQADESRAEHAHAKDENAAKSSRADHARSSGRERAKTARSIGNSRIDSPVSNADTSPVATQQLEFQISNGATMEGEFMPIDGNMASSCGVNGADDFVSDGRTSTTAGMSNSNTDVGGRVTMANNPGQSSSQGVAAGSAGVLPVAGSASTGEGSAGGKDGSATTSQDGAITATGKAAATNGRASGGNEFQQLLSQLNRSRPVGLDRGEVSTVAAKFKVSEGSKNNTVDLRSPGSVAELARIMRTQIGSQQSSMVLELSPEELGRVRVDVRMQDSNVAIQFGTETAAGQREIKNRLDELKGALEQQGITVERVSVEMLPTTVGPDLEQDSADQEQPDAQRRDLHADGGQGGGQGAMADSHRGEGGAAGEADAVMWLPIAEDVVEATASESSGGALAVGGRMRAGVDVMV